jgi:signal recognition particle subunit SRP54
MDVADLNKLLKQHRQMADMMKKMGKGGGMKQMLKQMLGKGGGMPDPSKMSAAELEEAARGMKQGLGGMGGGMPGMGGMGRGGLTLPAGLSGLTRKK